MKKLISVVLMICIVLALASCNKSATTSLETTPEDSAVSFVKPEQYASVLLITINPQFRLYLDENGKVLAVEAVNKDAQSFKDSISFENKSFETVIEAIVTEANKNGFVKADTTINFEIVESKEADKDQSAILSKAEKTANDTAGELKIEIKVNVDEIKTNDDASSSEIEQSDAQSSSKPTDDKGTTVTKPNNNQTTSKPANNQSTSETKPNNSQTTSKPANNQSTSDTKPNNDQSTSKPTHTHSFSAATCTQPKKCSCGAVEGKALGHDYKDGVCTRCNAKDPNFKPLTSVVKKQGKWTLQYLSGKELYSVSITVCKAGENFADVGIGALLSTLPSDMQNDPDIKNYCEVFNGEYYYIGMGNGDSIKTVTEENNTVTLTDSSENKLVLTRTGENTLKCAFVSDSFANISGISVGEVFTFVAD